MDPDFYDKIDLHVHVPEGAIPKDGPSAGITITTALVSALTKIPVRPDVAMTGEITLRGRVLAIGGLKEKALAARQADIRIIIIPKDNEKDLEEIPSSVRRAMKIVPVEHLDEVLKHALELDNPEEFYERSRSPAPPGHRQEAVRPAGRRPHDRLKKIGKIGVRPLFPPLVVAFYIGAGGEKGPDRHPPPSSALALDLEDGHRLGRHVHHAVGQAPVGTGRADPARTAGRHCADGVHHVQTADDLAEDRITVAVWPVVELGIVFRVDEKLGPWPSSPHWCAPSPKCPACS